MKFIDKLKDLFTDEEEVVETKEIELEKEEKEEEFASAALFFSLISSIDFTPDIAIEGAKAPCSIQCSNVRRGL